jgi:hypothetical protein
MFSLKPSADSPAERAEAELILDETRTAAALELIHQTLAVASSGGHPNLTDTLLDLRNILTGDRHRRGGGMP